MYHNSLATGKILLYGPAEFPGGGAGFQFKVLFQDPDGIGTDARVVGQLRHVGPQGIQIIATLDSTEETEITDEIQVMSKSLRWSELSQEEGYYTVRIYVDRAHTEIAPAAFGYDFCGGLVESPIGYQRYCTEF